MRSEWTAVDMVRWMSDFFENKGIESPRKVADILICDVLQCSRLDLYMQFDRPFKPAELDMLRSAVKRVGAGEPVQHVVGNVEFADVQLLVSKEVLIPRPETEEVLQHCVNCIDKLLKCSNTVHVLDIGTGSGALALAIAAKFPQVQCVGVDISAQAVDVAKHNAAKNGIENVAFFQTDILSVVPSKTYDLIVSNPPYIPTSEYEELEDIVRLYEPRVALTDEMDGLTFYRRFAELLPTILKPNGCFVFECGWDQGAKIVQLMQQAGLTCEMHKDLNGHDRIVVGTR